MVPRSGRAGIGGERVNDPCTKGTGQHGVAVLGRQRPRPQQPRVNAVWQSPPERWVSAIGRTAVGTFVVAPRLRTPPDLDAALRLAAHHHDEIRALAGLLAERFVRDDQDRAGRYALGDAADGLLGDAESGARRLGR